MLAFFNPDNNSSLWEVQTIIIPIYSSRKKKAQSGNKLATSTWDRIGPMGAFHHCHSLSSWLVWKASPYSSYYSPISTPLFSATQHYIKHNYNPMISVDSLIFKSLEIFLRTSHQIKTQSLTFIWLLNYRLPLMSKTSSNWKFIQNPFLQHHFPWPLRKLKQFAHKPKCTI